MQYLIIFFLMGAIVAVLTAIVHSRTNKKEAHKGEGLLSKTTITGAYILIALAWPISIAIFTYALISGLLTHDHSQDTG